MCCDGKTCCEHIMQRTSHPWPFSNTALCDVQFGKPVCLMRHPLPFRCWTWPPLYIVLSSPASLKQFIGLDSTGGSSFWPCHAPSLLFPTDSPPSHCDWASLIAGPSHHMESQINVPQKGVKMRFRWKLFDILGAIRKKICSNSPS